jgi:hypothetical protein
MSGIDKTTLADGFLVCLLGVNTDNRKNALEFSAILFDGGRHVDQMHYEGTLFSIPSAEIDRLRRCLVRVATGPNILAVFGRGWKELLVQILPDYVSESLRILELLRVARALRRQELAARATIEQIRLAYRIAARCDTDGVRSSVYEDLLWSIVSEAEKKDMGWPQLLEACENSMLRVPLERFAFGEVALALVPELPGVYIMYDASGQVLYVGKAANLARRLRDYFRSVSELPPKLKAVWERIRNFEYKLVGSELEALLMENKLISALQPDINVQRHVAEGESRYGFPLLPVAIICSSTVPKSVEVFFCNANGGAFQCRIRADRPARKQLARFIRGLGGKDRTSASAGVTDLGVTGNEIACRYFARFKDKLNWMEVDITSGVDAFVASLLKAVTVVFSHSPEPGEFRVGE